MKKYLYVVVREKGPYFHHFHLNELVVTKGDDYELENQYGNSQYVHPDDVVEIGEFEEE